jgi:hypothetical protein
MNRISEGWASNDRAGRKQAKIETTMSLVFEFRLCVLALQKFVNVPLPTLPIWRPTNAACRPKSAFLGKLSLGTQGHLPAYFRYV